MKKLLANAFLVFCVYAGFGQTKSNAVRLNPEAGIVNTIFWQNALLKPVSEGVPVSYSALDSTTSGVGNVRLRGNPFSNQFRINSSSLAYNAGADEGLRNRDTLDLDYLNRHGHERCPQIDMGAYEFQSTPTKIKNELLADAMSTCEGTPLEISVTAEGDNVTYQWQKDGEDLVGQVSSTMILGGSIGDAGVYRVIALGDCCNDTSKNIVVTIDTDPANALVMMRDTTIQSGESVLLQTISHVGTLTWHERDFQTILSTNNTILLTNITEGRKYVVVAENGTCPNKAIAWVNIFIEGAECKVETRENTTICHGDSFRLITNSASVNYRWTDLQTNSELPEFAVLMPDSTSRYVAEGLNAAGDVCASDTLTVTVNKVANFNEVMGGITTRAVCENDPVNLTSFPPADMWLDEQGFPLGTGDIFNIHTNSGTANIFTAQRSRGGCTANVQVTIYVNPPDIKVSFTHTEICIGESVLLSTNIDPALIRWQNVATGAFVDPYLTPAAPGLTTYRAVYDDARCGFSFSKNDVTVLVDAMPDFDAFDQLVQENDMYRLQSDPPATYWTRMDGARFLEPRSGMRATETEEYIGWYRQGACLISKVAKITVQPAPADTFYITVPLPNSDCFNEGWACVTLDDGSDPNLYSYVWIADASGDTLQTTLPPGDTIFGLSAGRYRVDVTNNATGKTVTENFEILPTDSITFVIVPVRPNNADFNNGELRVIDIRGAVGPFHYTWFDEDDNIIAEGEGRDRITGLEEGEYRVVVIDRHLNKNCESAPATFLLTREMVGGGILPNLFITPNGDGKNDYLKIENIDRFPKNRVYIFNAYGENVREFRNYNNKGDVFDGRNKRGQMLPDGVYYYIIEPEGAEAMVGWLLMKGSKHN
jgi:gliding motility-associated-like protein